MPLGKRALKKSLAPPNRVLHPLCLGRLQQSENKRAPEGAPSMKRFRPILALGSLLPLLGLSASVSFAQPPPDDFGGGGPMFDEGPEGHRPPPPGRGGPRGGGGPKGMLDGLWHGVERMQNGPDALALSKAQASRIVALVKPWTMRASMSDADAQKLAEGVEAVLTSEQKSRVGPPGRGGPRRGGRGGFGPPPPRDGDDDFGPPPPPPDGEFGPPLGRGGGPNGQRRGGRSPFPATYNPFYAPTGREDWKQLPNSTQQLMARRYREIRAVLENLSRFSKS